MHYGEDRYVIGKVYPFVEKQSFEDNDYRIVMCECVSEHTVPIEYSSNHTTTGYAFKDDCGNIWHNQYPTAKYGQVDTSTDYKLYRWAPIMKTLYDLPYVLNTMRVETNIFKNVRAKQLYESLLKEDIPEFGKYVARPFMSTNDDGGPIIILWNAITHLPEKDIVPEHREIYAMCDQFAELIDGCRPTHNLNTLRGWLYSLNKLLSKFREIDTIVEHDLHKYSSRRPVVSFSIRIRFEKNGNQYVFADEFRAKS